MGTFVGREVGALLDGVAVGNVDGRLLGVGVGRREGTEVGFLLGFIVGKEDGINDDGSDVGYGDTSVGAIVG